MDEKEDFVALSELVFERTRTRLIEPTDKEYLWEPAPSCWSLQVREDGTATADWEANPETPPYTTIASPYTSIAWRLCHLIDCYGSVRNELWLRGAFDDAGRSRSAPQASAAAALVALDIAHEWWAGLLASIHRQS